MGRKLADRVVGSHMPTDLELLEVEIDTLWIRDQRGRLVKSYGSGGWKAPHLLFAASKDGQIMAVGSEVPDALAANLEAAVAGKPASPDPATPPTCIARCEQLLKESLGPVELAGGPSYAIQPPISFQSPAQVRLSDGGDTEALRSISPEGGGWSSEEWNQLLDGAIGPWAFAISDDRVIAICHSARLGERGAEAGVWTDPDFRGQGHAAAVTAAWGSLLAPSGRHLFYSTSSDNLSSQRVAERLDLALIGWRWQLGTPRTA